MDGRLIRNVHWKTTQFPRSRGSSNSGPGVHKCVKALPCACRLCSLEESPGAGYSLIEKVFFLSCPDHSTDRHNAHSPHEEAT